MATAQAVRRSLSAVPVPAAALTGVTAGKGHSLLRADVGAPARDSEHQALAAQQFDRAQHGVAADVVFLLQLLDRRQRAGAPLALSDLGAQDRGELPVGRLGQSMIHSHKINVGQYRPGLTRGYICSALVCVTLHTIWKPPDAVAEVGPMTEVHDEQAIAAAGPRDEPALVLARRLATAGLGVEVSLRRDTCELTIVGVTGGKSLVALDTSGQARWYYEPAAGPGTNPAALTAIIAYLLGVPHGTATLAAYRALPLKGQVGRSLQDQGLIVTLRVSEDLESFEATTDIDVTSPARPWLGTVTPLRRRRPRLALRLAGSVPRKPRRPHRRHHPDPAAPLNGDEVRCTALPHPFGLVRRRQTGIRARRAVHFQDGISFP